MAHNPFFTICIPVYNVEPYIRASIDSVLEQSEQDFEIVLVDDGSQDSSGKICDEYAEKYPGIIRVIHKENEGLFAARLEAIAVASGDYLTFLDSDDFYYPELLGRVRDALSDTEADMVIWDYEIITESANVKDEYKKDYYTLPHEDGTVFEGDGLKQIRRTLACIKEANSICIKCIKRKCLRIPESVRNLKNLNYDEDTLLSAIFIDAVEKVYYLKQPLYGYRNNTESICHNFSMQCYRNLKTVNMYLFPYLKSWGIGEEGRAHHAAYDYIYLAFGCIVSLFDRLQAGEAERKEWDQAIAYLVSDQDLRKAYALKMWNSIPLYYRGAIRSLVKGHRKLLYLQMKCLYMLKCLKNKIVRK